MRVSLCGEFTAVKVTMTNKPLICGCVCGPPGSQPPPYIPCTNKARLTRSTLRLNIGSVRISTGRFADSDRYASPTVCMHVCICMCEMEGPSVLGPGSWGVVLTLLHTYISTRGKTYTGQELHHPPKRRYGHPAGENQQLVIGMHACMHAWMVLV